MFEGIGKLIARYPKTVLFIWIAILLLSLLFSPKLKDHLTVGGFSDPSSESGIADLILKQQFDGITAQRVVLVVENPEINTDDSHFAETVKLLESAAEENRLVVRTTSAFSSETDTNLLLPDKHRAYVYLDLNASDNDAMKFVDSFKEQLQQMQDELEGYQVLVSGGPGIYYDMNTASKESVATVERFGLPIVFVLLLLVFRSVIASLLPLLIGIFSILTTMAVIYLLTPYMQLSTLLTNIVTMLGLGVAIDYALFITQRFREEMSAHGDTKLAIINAVATSGRSVFFAGLTIAVSLASLLLPNTLLFRSVAVGGFVVVIVSIAAAITLLPAVLVLIGKRVDLLKLPAVHPSFTKKRFWDTLIRFMIKRAVPFLIVGLLLVSVFLPFIPQMQMHVPVAAFNELPDKSDAKQGMQAMVEDFGVGKMFPIRVLLEFNGDSIYEKETVHTVFEITQKLKQLDGVSDVLGYTSLDGQFTSAEQYEQLYANLDQAPQAVREKLKSMVSSDEHKTVIYALPTFAPNTAEAREVVQEIRNLLSDHSNGTYKAYVSGETAMGMDYDSKIMKQIPIVVTVSLIFTFLLLLIAFRSIILPIKAIILNGLVTISTLGFLVFMFQNGNLPGTTPQALNVNTPVLLFCILFGLSIDYEVILVSRIREYYKRSGNNQESIVNGFVSTAGMINGAAAIMVTVFGMFVFADIQIVQELGVGLALAILLDAIVVRTIIVPLSMKLLGRMNWWIPFSKSKKV